MGQANFIDRCYQVAMIVAYRLMLAQWFLLRPKRYGACAVVWVEDKVLLVRNSYKSQSSFPGGGRTLKEEAIEAAARELFEETGIKVPASQLRFAISAHSKSEWKHDQCDYFEVTLDAEPDFQIDNREIIFGKFVPFEQLDEFPLICSAKQYVQWKRKQLAKANADTT